MKVIPILKNTTAQAVLKYRSIPCYDDAKRIILSETEKDNEIILAGDASSHPSETYVIIDFADKPKNQYDNLKTCSYKDEEYQYLIYSDNNGALQINFGRIENKI